jgi:hypothetical protein
MPEYNGDLTSLRFVGKGICGKSSNDIINTDITINHYEIIDFIKYLCDQNLDFVKHEGLYLFDNKVAFTSGQGE